MSYQVVLHPAAYQAAERHRQAIADGSALLGARLAAHLATAKATLASTEDLLDALLATKDPQIFAESAVRGDGSDWTADELALLGDLGVAMEVAVFDDGEHGSPRVHETPLRAWLLFIPGVLLRNDRGGTPVDLPAVVHGGSIDPARYDALIERRLLPLLHFASERAEQAGRRALVTVPGIGCGQFAGRFRGHMGEHLERALHWLLERHGARLPALRAVYFDPYGERSNRRHEIGQVSLLVRPLTQGNAGRPQLCPPARYEDADDDFANCLLFSFVAWDHVSWPGNDFWAGSRATDDGVKAAATDTMRVMTGVEGAYDEVRNMYLPPPPWTTWESVVRAHDLRMLAAGRLQILPRS